MQRSGEAMMQLMTREVLLINLVMLSVTKHFDLTVHKICKY
jgi:hypothetical protein